MENDQLLIWKDPVPPVVLSQVHEALRTQLCPFFNHLFHYQDSTLWDMGRTRVDLRNSVSYIQDVLVRGNRHPTSHDELDYICPYNPCLKVVKQVVLKGN